MIRPLPFFLFNSFDQPFAYLDYNALAIAASIDLLVSKETAAIASSLFSIVIHFQLFSHLEEQAKSFFVLVAISLYPKSSRASVFRLSIIKSIFLRPNRLHHCFSKSNYRLKNHYLFTIK